MEAGEVFRYMAGHRTECVRAEKGALVCCTNATVLVWDTRERALVARTGKSGRASGIVLWRGEVLLVLSRELRNASGDRVAALEFASQVLVVDGRLVAIGEKRVLVVGEREKEHGLGSGVCTGAFLSGDCVYASFENGRVFEIRDVLGSFRARAVVSFRETVSSIDRAGDRVLAGIFDGKVAVVDRDGGFVFTRVPGEVRRVASAGDDALVLLGDGSLLLFDSALRFVRVVDRGVVDVSVSGTAVFVATARAVSEYGCALKKKILSPKDGAAQVQQALAGAEEAVRAGPPDRRDEGGRGVRPEEQAGAVDAREDVRRHEKASPGPPHQH